MRELGSGAVREMTSIRLSRAACMAIAMNADRKKEKVKTAWNTSLLPWLEAWRVVIWN